MRPRKVKDVVSVLKKKGFVDDKDTHHAYYYLWVDGKRTTVCTYMSHGTKGSELGQSLMGSIKKQLKFDDNKLAENFFDCTFTKDDYSEMIRAKGLL